MCVCSWREEKRDTQGKWGKITKKTPSTHSGGRKTRKTQERGKNEASTISPSSSPRKTMQKGVPRGPKDQREREKLMCKHLDNFGVCRISNPLPSGSGPATSPIGPGRTPFYPGGGRLDHPGAPGTGAPLCYGVRDPLGSYHHPCPLCIGIRDPLGPHHHSPPFVLVGSAPGDSPGGLPLLCDGMSTLRPSKLISPLPLATLAASPYLPELLGTDLPRLPASGRPPALRTADARLDAAGLVPSRPTQMCLRTFLKFRPCFAYLVWPIDRARNSELSKLSSSAVNRL